MPEVKTILNHHILYESESVCIYHDFVEDWIYVDWIGEQTLDSIKTGCEKLLYFLVKERCHKLLNDNTRVTNIWSDAAEWIATDFAPRAAQAGLNFCAWVYSPDHFSRLSTDEVLEQQHTEIITIPFENLEVAKDWLRSVKVQ
jgi:hypothetical protein